MSALSPSRIFWSFDYLCKSFVWKSHTNGGRPTSDYLGQLFLKSVHAACTHNSRLLKQKRSHCCVSFFPHKHTHKLLINHTMLRVGLMSRKCGLSHSEQNDSVLTKIFLQRFFFSEREFSSLMVYAGPFQLRVRIRSGLQAF